MKLLNKPVSYTLYTILLIGVTLKGEDLLSKIRVIPNGPPENFLPKDPLLHIRIESLQRLITVTDEILTELVPSNLIKNKKLIDALSSPSPLLSLLNLDEESVNNTGIDLSREITLTFYPGRPHTAHILTVPIGDWARFTNFITSILKSPILEAGEFISISSNLQALLIKSKDGTPLYVIASPDRIYVTRQNTLLHVLAQGIPEATMATQPFLKDGITNVLRNDIVIIINGKIAKLSEVDSTLLKFSIGTILSVQKTRLLDSLPPERRRYWDMYVAQNYGVKDLAHFSEYMVALITGTIYWLIDEIGSITAPIECSTIALKIDLPYVELIIKEYYSYMEEKQSQITIPKSEVENIIQMIGSNFTLLKAQVNSAKPAKYTSLEAWIKHVILQLEVRKLDPTFFARVAATIQQLKPTPKPFEKGEWFVIVETVARSLPDPLTYTNFKEYLREFKNPLITFLFIVPGLSIKEFESTLAQQVKTATSNYEAICKLFNLQDNPFFPFIEYSFTPKGILDSIHAYQIDTTLSTAFGLFGYTKHSLVNSKMYYAKEIGRYLIYEKRLLPSDKLISISTNYLYKPNPAVADLLERLPTDFQLLQMNRIIPYIVDVAEVLTKIELLIRKEFDEYLAMCNKIAASVPEDKLFDELKILPLPSFANALCQDKESGKFYLVWGNGLVYPRPPVMPVIQDLLGEYKEAASNLGGLMIYKKSSQNVKELHVIQKLDSITYLIRTVGNRLGEALSNPEKLKTIKAIFKQPKDHSPLIEEEIIVRNLKGTPPLGISKTTNQN